MVGTYLTMPAMELTANSRSTSLLFSVLYLDNIPMWKPQDLFVELEKRQFCVILSTTSEPNVLSEIICPRGLTLRLHISGVAPFQTF